MFEFKNKSKGIFLIEALLYIMLSGLLLSFLYEMYVINRESYRKQSIIMKIQTNASIATTILTNEIKMAGYIGCAKLSNDFPLISDIPLTLTNSTRLIGLPNDAFQVIHADLSHANLLAMENGSTLSVNKLIHFKSGDILIISDCKTAEIFQVAEIHIVNNRQHIVPLNVLHHKFGQDAEISRLEINKFYVTKTNRQHEDGSFIFALCMETINGETEELVEDVQRIHILYFVKQNNEILPLKAADIMDWSTVVGVSVAIDFYSPFVNKKWNIVTALND